MDIFNRKRVAELEEDLRGIKAENDRLRRELSTAEHDVQELLELKQSYLEDCVPGEYCAVCNFAKMYYKHYYVSGYTSGSCHNKVIRGYICDKANACKNFAQKEIEKND